MALYAGIGVSTLNKWLSENEELRERVAELRESPAMRARKAVVGALDDPDRALRYLERKKGKEFMPNAKLEMSVAALPPGTVDPMLDALREEYEQRMRKALAAGPETERPPIPEVKPEPTAPDNATPPHDQPITP